MAPQREWFDKDYYKVLGVPSSATDSEIGKAYRKLAKQTHPDAHPGSEERFKEISAAYDVLGDKTKRKEYDEVRRMGAAGSVFGTPAGSGSGGTGGFTSAFHVDDLGDLIGNIFNRGGAAAGRPPTTATGGPQRGKDVDAALTLSFVEAVRGLTTTVNVTSEGACSTCGGSGAAAGTTPITCEECGGTGVINDNQGMFSFSRPCPTCGGLGRRVEHPCPACGGLGREMRARQIKVRIPAGVEDGQRIRVKGRGVPGRHGGPPGDLFVTVHVTPHPLFGRRQRDLTITVPVTFAEATLGAEISVPTLDRPVKLKVPPGSRSGRTLRVRGRGVPAAAKVGDLLVTIEVAVPTSLTPEQEQAVKAFDAATDGDAVRASLQRDR